MAVEVEFISVLVPVDALETRYPGGLTGYERDCPNGSFCCDGHLTRVGFMNPNDLWRYIDRLEDKGLRPFDDESCKDIAVATMASSNVPCDWLHFGSAPGVGLYACLKEHEHDPGDLFTPDGRIPMPAAHKQKGETA